MIHVVYFLVMAVVMLILSRILPGFQLSGIGPAIWASIILGIVNAIVRPILFVLTLPLTILTLGLFMFILNAIILFIVAALVPGFRINGWGTAIIAAIILGIVNMLWKAAVRERGRDITA